MSFISMASMLGIALGIATLIVVMSVMNGFGKEIRKNMLSGTTHIVLRGRPDTISDWKEVAAKVKENSHVTGVMPFIATQGMMSARGINRGAIIRGIQPELVDTVFPLTENMVEGSIDLLQPHEFNVIIGRQLAEQLGLFVGQSITVTVIKGSVSPAGFAPTFKKFKVVGLFEISSMYDQSHLFIHINDAAKLLKLGHLVSGLQIQIDDELIANSVSYDLSRELGYHYYLVDWMTEHAQFFKAVQMEKVVMFIILSLIIAVAAFNLVSSLVMMVNDKEQDIAILRTLGASRFDIMRIFIIQGTIIGVMGIVIGLVTGLLIASHVTEIVEFIQNLFHVQFIYTEVYRTDHVPSDIHFQDVSSICWIAFFMSVIATIYPSYKASRILPAEALRHE